LGGQLLLLPLFLEPSLVFCMVDAWPSLWLWLWLSLGIEISRDDFVFWFLGGAAAGHSCRLIG